LLVGTKGGKKGGFQEARTRREKTNYGSQLFTTTVIGQKKGEKRRGGEGKKKLGITWGFREPRRLVLYLLEGCVTEKRENLRGWEGKKEKKGTKGVRADALVKEINEIDSVLREGKSYNLGKRCFPGNVGCGGGRKCLREYGKRLRCAGRSFQRSSISTVLLG